MATIAVHEFISLDGVFESPSWTFEFGFDPKMGETIGAFTGQSNTILLGRKTHEMFAPPGATAPSRTIRARRSSTRPRSSSSAPTSRPSSGTTPPVSAPMTPMRSGG